jgi:ADP-ribose pyrophosphatase YjhB (NUDIX family)
MKDKEKYKLRHDARAVILRKDNKILIISSPKSKNYHHKLPGGGVEESENIEQALQREIKEEVGGKIEIVKEIGEIIQMREKYQLKQISHCFLTRLIGKLGKANLTEDEKKAGYTFEWYSIEEAIQLFCDSPEEEDAKLVQSRDYHFLMRAKQIIREG